MYVLLTIVLVLAASAESSHRGNPGEENGDEQKSVGSVSVPNFAVEMPRSESKGGEKVAPGNDEKAAVKSSAAKSKVSITRGSYPLIIFAQDKSAPAEGEQREAISLINEMKVLVKRKASGVQVLEATALTPHDIANVYDNDTGAREKAGRASVDTALLVVNAPAKWNAKNGLVLRGRKGDIPQQKWEEAIKKLSRSIFGIGGTGKLETILLTDLSGNADCSKLPGPLFGMSPAGLSRDLAAMALWTRLQRERSELAFPLTAREWFESWGMTNKVSRRRYFYCPVANVKGYVGYKSEADPIHDNAGFEWDINDR